MIVLNILYFYFNNRSFHFGIERLKQIDFILVNKLFLINILIYLYHKELKMHAIEYNTEDKGYSNERHNI